MARRKSEDAGKRVVLREFHEDEGATPMWEVVQIVEAPSDRAAIKEVAGKPGTSDAKPGKWKSVPLSNWKGTANYERPPEPLVDVSWLD